MTLYVYSSLLVHGPLQGKSVIIDCNDGVVACIALWHIYVGLWDEKEHQYRRLKKD